ncbi:unnamed protein product, partial [Cyprideis torosa]
NLTKEKTDDVFFRLLIRRASNCGAPWLCRQRTSAGGGASNTVFEGDRTSDLFNDPLLASPPQGGRRRRPIPGTDALSSSGREAETHSWYRRPLLLLWVDPFDGPFDDPRPIGRLQPRGDFAPRQLSRGV